MRPLRLLVPLAAVALLAAAGCTTTPVLEPAPHYELGGVGRPVSTDVPEAQAWFDRGLALCYAFNHEEAVRCFQHAVDADPACAMAHWGIAYALGPNINNTQMSDEAIRRACESVQTARLLGGRTEVERDLVEALATRYEWPERDRARLDRDYAEAMRHVLRAHPHDADVIAIAAEAMMMIHPWKYWSPAGEPAPGTPEIVGTLEAGLALEPDHPGLCHFYIHAMEASPTPEKALPAANRLRNRMPGAGHLVHMPSHIDVLLGHYADAVEANARAIEADGDFVEARGRHNFYTLYRIHNYHFLVYAAMFDGQSARALRAARELVDEIPPDMLRRMPDYLDAFVPTEAHVLVRFGRWEDILTAPAPPEELPMTCAIWHYARAVAFAATGRVGEAEAEREAFLADRMRVPATAILFQNTCQDILGVAEAMIDGEIEYRRGNVETAFVHLREAVRRDDALNYDEPWGWMQPARHALGALLLEQGRVAEAEHVYRADLARHPDNPWALHGLAECLQRLGLPEEARVVAARFDEARVRSDVDITRSCYCRLD